MPVVYVARHGETEWNQQGRYQGQRESSLTELGRRQAAALAGALGSSGARRVIASPLSRCVESARPLAAALGVEVETDERLIEIAHGTWEGRLRDEIEREDAARMHVWRSQPASVHFEGGESLGEVASRWRAFQDAFSGNDDAVVVTHDVLVRIAILLASGRALGELWEPRVGNGAYARFDASAGTWQLIDECRDEHLAGMLADTSRQAL